MAIDGVLLDLSGCVYEGDAAIEGALSAIDRLRAASLPLRFVTNTTRSAKPEILAKLSGLGLTVPPNELFTPVEAALDWLDRNRRVPVPLVHPAIEAPFSAPSGSGGKAVVVGDAGNGFTYASLNQAFRAVTAGAPILALAKNRCFEDDDGLLSLDAGPFVAALEYATGQEAVLLGKPSPPFFAAALASMGVEGGRAVMVGDDAESDVAGALNAGIGQAVLVRTGKYRKGAEEAFDPRPTATVADLAESADWILANQG